MISDSELIRLRMTLGRVGRLLRQQTDDVLSYTLASLLLNIARSGPVSAGELASTEGVSAPSVTRSLKRLEDRGLITRSTNPRDRRTAVVELSEAGETERQHLLSRRDAWLSERLQRLSDEDIDLLMAALPVLDKLWRPEKPD